MRCFAAENRDAALCHAEVIRQKCAEDLVRFALLRRGRHFDLPCPVRKLAGDLVLRALRDYFNRDVHIWPAGMSTGCGRLQAFGPGLYSESRKNAFVTASTRHGAV